MLVKRFTWTTPEVVMWNEQMSLKAKEQMESLEKISNRLLATLIKDEHELSLDLGACYFCGYHQGKIIKESSVTERLAIVYDMFKQTKRFQELKKPRVIQPIKNGEHWCMVCSDCKNQLNLQKKMQQSTHEQNNSSNL